MQGELLADLAAENGIDVVTIVDSAGFAILAHPMVDDAERLAAKVIALIGQAETRPQDEEGNFLSDDCPTSEDDTEFHQTFLG